MSALDRTLSRFAPEGKNIPRPPVAEKTPVPFSSTWLGEDQAPIRPYLLQQAFGGQRTLSIRRGEWKYLDHTGSGGNRYENDAGLKPFHLPDTAPDAPGQLYNLATDPGETKNLAYSGGRLDRTADLNGLHPRRPH
jgi:hypothetical protein